MNYTRTTLSPALPFDLDAVKDYARITHSDEDSEVQTMALTAAAEIEASCDVALITQTITATTDQWPGCIIDLPVGPVQEGTTPTVAVIEVDGSLTAVASGWWLEAGRYPRLHFTTTPGARLKITYQAGYGADAGAIPADLTTALHDQAARLYDTRSDPDLKPGIASGAARIMARHRRVRV